MHESGDFSWKSTFALINWYFLHDENVQIKFYHEFLHDVFFYSKQLIPVSVT